MLVRIRLFAVLREGAGASTVQLRLRPGATVGDALEQLAGHGTLGELLGRVPVRMAVNRDYAETGTVLSEGDELALIPPVSGGAGNVHVRVSEEPLSLERLAAVVGDPGAGALVLFAGVTRDVDRLEYEAYTEMATERIARIMSDCVTRHGARAAAAEHRVGCVALGEPSVIVAVSAAHRNEAFAAAREAIDRIKAEAPIWKREHPQREQPRWVPGRVPGGEPAASADADLDAQR